MNQRLVFVSSRMNQRLVFMSSRMKQKLVMNQSSALRAFEGKQTATMVFIPAGSSPHVFGNACGKHITAIRARLCGLL